MRLNRFAPALVLTVLALAAFAERAIAAEHIVFVGSYTGGAGRGITAMKFDDATGAFTPIGVVADTPSPSFLTLSADGRFLFAVNEISNYGGQQSGSVRSYAVDRATGRLTELSVQSSQGADPCHLALDKTGRFLAVANYTSGTFAILPVSADGKLGLASVVLKHEGTGPVRGRQDGPHAHEVVFDPTNKFLFVVDLGLDRVFVYHFDAATGRTSPNDPASVSMLPGAGPRHLALHPTLPIAYVITELSSTMVTLSWDAASGTLTPKGTPLTTLPANYAGQSTTAELAVHPNGRFLYGSNRGHDSIAVFSISATGDVAFVQHSPTRGRTPRHFTLDPSGRWLIAENQETNTLAVFAVNQQTGALTPAPGPLTLSGSPVSLVFLR